MRMSHVGDTSNQTQDDVTSGSTSRSGAASSSSVVGGYSAKKLKFNARGLMGLNLAKSSSRLGHLARMHVPICYNAWPKVPARYKDQLWKAYKDENPDVKESQRDIFMRKACDAWKKLKGKLRASLVGDDVTKWKEQVPECIKSEDWEQYCDHEATQYQKDVRKRNNVVKDSCERKRTRQEMIKEGNIEHGDYCDHEASQYQKDVKKRNKVVKDSYERKRTRREMIKEGNIERNLTEELENLREEMKGVKSALTEFINIFKRGNFVNVGDNVHKITSPIITTTAPKSVTHAPSTFQFPSVNDLTPCKILSPTGEIVGYGRKMQLDAVASVRGHLLRPREVRIVLDNIKLLEFPIWGGKQGSCSTLSDVGKGGIMYWHDDFLPPLDDTQEQ